MTQQPNSETPELSDKLELDPTKQDSQQKVIFLVNAGNFLGRFGKFFLGDFRNDVYTTIQEAIALYLLFKIPGWIGQFITGQDYAGFDQCMAWTQWNVNRYACYAIVASGFSLWIVIIGRIIFRLIKNLLKF